MKKKQSNLLLVPCILLVALVPLLVHMHDFASNLSQFNWYPMVDEASDFFMYQKSVAIIVISALMCVILAVRYFSDKKKFRFNYLFVPLIIYAGFTLCSSLFSKYQYFSFHGISEVFESVWVLLGYCVIAFYAYEIVQTMDDVDFFMKWFTIGIVVMLALGMTQALGVDFFGTRLGKMLITNQAYWGQLDQISLVFEKGRAYLSLYNPNYVASYFALVIPMLVALAVRQEKKLYKACYAVLIVLSVFVLMASGNRSGVAAFVITGVFSVVLFFKHVVRYWKVIVPSVLVIVCIVVGFVIKNPFIIEKFQRLLQGTETAEEAISQIVTGEDAVAFTYKGNVLKIAYDEDENGALTYHIVDGSGSDVACALNEESTLVLQDERFDGFTIKSTMVNEAQSGMSVHADGYDWVFTKAEDGYYYRNAFGRLDKINNAPRVAVGFLERILEERGTIWSKTLPLLKNTVLFGTGADTFTIVYPQDDYVDKTYDGTTTALDVKPHCYYLQVAVQSGIVAAIAVLVLFGWYIIRSIKLYHKLKFEKPDEIVGAGLLMGVFTYMIISILNDSTVNVAPIFWTLFGMGVAVNELVAKRIKTEAQENDASVKK